MACQELLPPLPITPERPGQEKAPLPATWSVLTAPSGGRRLATVVLLHLLDLGHSSSVVSSLGLGGRGRTEVGVGHSGVKGGGCECPLWIRVSWDAQG